MMATERLITAATGILSGRYMLRASTGLGVDAAGDKLYASGRNGDANLQRPGHSGAAKHAHLHGVCALHKAFCLKIFAHMNKN